MNNHWFEHARAVHSLNHNSIEGTQSTKKKTYSTSQSTESEAIDCSIMLRSCKPVESIQNESRELEDAAVSAQFNRLLEAISMVSHDLRTPLSSIKLVLDCAKHGVFGYINEAGVKAISGAENSVDNLINMINDLLDMEKHDSGEITLFRDRAQTDEILESVMQTVSAEAARKQITIIKEGENVSTVIDINRIRRTLVNLVGNAIKFSPTKSTIVLSAKRTPSQTALFSIRDQGPGIPDDKLQSVFDKYRQVGTCSEGERGGSGLGLAICKKLVEGHGGNIGVRSKLGYGSEFWFEVPNGT